MRGERSRQTPTRKNDRLKFQFIQLSERSVQSELSSQLSRNPKLSNCHMLLSHLCEIRGRVEVVTFSRPPISPTVLALQGGGGYGGSYKGLI
jgi:hypothetical protein